MQRHRTMDYEKFRNPPPKIRVIIVSFVFALYGCLTGAIVSVFLGKIWLCAPLAALLAGYFGAKLELDSTFFDSGENKRDNSHDS